MPGIHDDSTGYIPALTEAIGIRALESGMDRNWISRQPAGHDGRNRGRNEQTGIGKPSKTVE